MSVIFDTTLDNMRANDVNLSLPFDVFLWFSLDQDDASQYMLAIGEGTNDCLIAQALATGLARSIIRTPSQQQPSSTAYTTGWHLMRMSLHNDGVNNILQHRITKQGESANDTEEKTLTIDPPTGYSDVYFGSRFGSADMLGKLAEVAIFSSIQSDSVYENMLAGKAPDKASGANLAHYWPLLGDANAASGSIDAYPTDVVFDTEDHPISALAGASSLDPSLLKPGLTTPDGSNLKPSLTSPSYTGGTPGESGNVKPSLVDKEGNLKAGLTTPDGSELKPSLKK